jgi:hypothetical protein
MTSEGVAERFLCPVHGADRGAAIAQVQSPGEAAEPPHDLEPPPPLLAQPAASAFASGLSVDENAFGLSGRS